MAHRTNRVLAPALGLAWLVMGACADSESGDPHGPLTMGPTSHGDAGEDDSMPSTGSDSQSDDAGPPTGGGETGSDSAGSDDGGTDTSDPTGSDTTGSNEPDPGSGGCHACLMQECRSQLDACKSDPACTCHAVCVEGGGSPGQCYLPCDIARSPTFDAIYDCSLARCPDACPEYGS